MRNALLVAALLLLSPTVRAEGEALTVDPPELSVGLFFHGADVTVRATRTKGDRAVFRLLGPSKEVKLKVKGRMWGVLWTSVDEVTFEDVPSLMLVQGEPTLPPEEGLTRAGLTPESLRKEVLGEDPAPAEELAFDEMKLLFEKRGTWSVSEAPAPDGAGTDGTVFRLPPDLPTGKFLLTVTFFDGDRVVGEQQTDFVVRRTGFVESVIRLAREHGFWYGMIAVGIAVLAGLATGYLFGLRKMRKE